MQLLHETFSPYRSYRQLFAFPQLSLAFYFLAAIAGFLLSRSYRWLVT